MRVSKPPTKQDIEAVKVELVAARLEIKSISDGLARVNTTINTKLQTRPVVWA